MKPLAECIKSELKKPLEIRLVSSSAERRKVLEQILKRVHRLAVEEIMLGVLVCLENNLSFAPTIQSDFDVCDSDRCLLAKNLNKTFHEAAKDLRLDIEIAKCCGFIVSDAYLAETVSEMPWGSVYNPLWKRIGKFMQERSLTAAT